MVVAIERTERVDVQARLDESFADEFLVHHCPTATIVFLPDQHGVVVNGSFQRFTRTEFRFFKCLVDHRGAFATHQTLMLVGLLYEETVGENTHVSTVWIGRVRKKLGPHAEKIVLTVPTIGYQLGRITCK